MNIRTVLTVIIIVSLAVAGVMYGNQALTFVSNVAKAQTYEKLLQPEVGSYYSVQSTSKKGDSVFVIGKVVSPQIGGTVIDKGELVTIEVPPASGKSLMRGPYLKVSIVRGVLTTRYFPSAREVVQDALEN